MTECTKYCHNNTKQQEKDKMTVKRDEKWLQSYSFSPLPNGLSVGSTDDVRHILLINQTCLTLIFKMRVVRAFLYSIRFLFHTVKSWGHLKCISECRLQNREQYSKGYVQFSCEAQQIYWGHKTWMTQRLHSLFVQETQHLADMLRLPTPSSDGTGKLAFHPRARSVFLLFSISSKLHFGL